MKPATKDEAKVLDVVLVELRRAMKMRGQLSLIIDPWTPCGGGVTLFASPNTDGRSYEIEFDRPARRRGTS